MVVWKRWDRRVAASVPGTMQVGVRGGGKLPTARSDKRLRFDLCRVTQVAEALPGDCLALKGFVGGRRGTGVQTGRRCLPSVTEPFMGRRLSLSFRGSYLFATEAAVQILAVLLHLLLLCDSLPPPCFSPCIAIHFICQMHKRGQTHNGETF